MAIEPFTGSVYFSPECHAEYEHLGFGGSPTKGDGVKMPDGPAYFASRGSVMGQVNGSVIAAAFGVFNPVIVEMAVDYAWSLIDAPTICAARTRGAVAQLERILGPEPDGVHRMRELLERAGEGLLVAGKPLFGGMMAQPMVGTPLGDVWRLADRLREYRGDVHTNAWTAAGFDGTQIGLITELYMGLPLRTYVRSRAWSAHELDAAEATLEAKGYLSEGALTDAGREAREAVEVATDEGCQAIADSLGLDIDEVTEVIGGWSHQVIAAHGYPGSLDDLAAVGGQ